MKIIYVDTETTGLDAKTNDIVQLAYIIEVDGEVKADRNILMAPTDPDAIEPKALAVQGRTKEEVMAFQHPGKAYKEFIKDVQAFINRYDRNDKFVWVGHNALFDIEFTRQWFNKLGAGFFGSYFHHVPVDTLVLARAAHVLGLIDTPNLKLGTLCEYFDIKLKAHDALEDIRATRLLYSKLMAFMTREALK